MFSEYSLTDKPDPITTSQIRVLEEALRESENRRYDLEEKVSNLHHQVEKITGLGPGYVRHLRTEHESSLRDRRQRLEKLDTQIRQELERYLTAKNRADHASAEAKELETAAAAMTSRVMAIIREAEEDDNPLILQPNVQGLGVDLVKLFRWVQGKLALRRRSKSV